MPGELSDAVSRHYSFIANYNQNILLIAKITWQNAKKSFAILKKINMWQAKLLPALIYCEVNFKRKFECWFYKNFVLKNPPFLEITLIAKFEELKLWICISSYDSLLVCNLLPGSSSKIPVSIPHRINRNKFVRHENVPPRGKNDRHTIIGLHKKFRGKRNV